MWHCACACQRGGMGGGSGSGNWNPSLQDSPTTRDLCLGLRPHAPYPVAAEVKQPKDRAEWQAVEPEEPALPSQGSIKEDKPKAQDTAFPADAFHALSSWGPQGDSHTQAEGLLPQPWEHMWLVLHAITSSKPPLPSPKGEADHAGLPDCKPDVISKLEQWEDPWTVKRDVPRGPVSEPEPRAAWLPLEKGALSQGQMTVGLSGQDFWHTIQKEVTEHEGQVAERQCQAVTLSQGKKSPEWSFAGTFSWHPFFTEHQCNPPRAQAPTSHVGKKGLTFISVLDQGHPCQEERLCMEALSSLPDLSHPQGAPIAGDTLVC
ncbi:hypothetical protein GH733_017381, partial [Mirounga leonina]